MFVFVTTKDIRNLGQGVFLLVAKKLQLLCKFFKIVVQLE